MGFEVGGESLGTLGKGCRGARDQVDLDVEPMEEREMFKLDRERDVSDMAGEATRIGMFWFVLARGRGVTDCGMGGSLGVLWFWVGVDTLVAELFDRCREA